MGRTEGATADTCQQVSQVFCAAAKVNASGTTAADWEHFATLLLEATYEATLWAAVTNMRTSGRPGGNRVILSLVGGGVFGNELRWIVDAINRSIKSVAAAAPTCGWGLEVCVAHFKEINPALEKSIYLGASAGSDDT